MKLLNRLVCLLLRRHHRYCYGVYHARDACIRYYCCRCDAYITFKNCFELKRARSLVKQTIIVKREDIL